MEIAETLKSLFDVGGVVVVTFMLWLVWKRLNDLTDRLIDILSEIHSQQLSTQLRNSEPDNEP